jgi:hypothetical protein
VIEELHREKQRTEAKPVAPTETASNISPGNGSWKDQANHVAKQLVAFAQTSPDFRAALAEPRMGKLLDADLDESEDGYLVSLNFAKGHSDLKLAKFGIDSN